MARYRKLPVEIDAVHYDGTNLDEITVFLGQSGKAQETRLPGPGRGLHDGILIRTLEGDMTASVGDWIIRGIQGEYYPCKPDIFAATYEAVNG
ncbi:hypothetical protein [Streptomyces sp. NPDC003832]